jgi:hypothetical protein
MIAPSRARGGSGPICPQPLAYTAHPGLRAPAPPDPDRPDAPRRRVARQPRCGSSGADPGRGDAPPPPTRAAVSRSSPTVGPAPRHGVYLRSHPRFVEHLAKTLTHAPACAKPICTWSSTGSTSTAPIPRADDGASVRGETRARRQPCIRCDRPTVCAEDLTGPDASVCVGAGRCPGGGAHD